MPFSAVRSPSMVLLACSAAVVLLTACAPLSPNTAQVGRTQVSLDSNPDLQWKYWGTDSEVLNVLPADLSKDKPLTAKLWQMRTTLGELVGVMSVRSNVDSLDNRNTVWTEDCPKQKGVLVERTQGLNVGRVDCLRIKRTANSTDWLAANDPAMATRLEAAGIFFARPVSYVSYQYTTSNGGYVEVQVLADHRLVRPQTRNSVDFLAAGRPLVDWSQDLALSVRQSTGYINGVMNVPPFPYDIDTKPYYETRTVDSDVLISKDTFKKDAPASEGESPAKP
ncbi:hypothetical protein [Comamonas odontotermitis]|uniref:hypothetical protein n=1 Tax=Comamonas odontotermitis TaxID=379895 RepID=UPI001CC59672|nr:hypothetical protein [Comamonas odontotermitis]UBB16902.1 hypothetical protein LAD35_19280 [Comamonas odontotermitis]